MKLSKNGGRVINKLDNIILIYKYGLDVDYYSIENVISICDTLIEKYDTVPYEIIEVALMSKDEKREIESKLDSILKYYDSIYATETLLGLVYLDLIKEKIEIGNAIKLSYKILFKTQACHEKTFYYLYSLDDSYELAINGNYFEVDTIKEEFIDEIKKYRIDGEAFLEILSSL